MDHVRVPNRPAAPRRLSAFVVAAALLTMGDRADAWGTSGHRIVCEIAWRETSDAGRGLARTLLDVEDAAAFADTCTWADDVREQSGFSWSKPHHYAEPPRGEPFDLAQHCPDGGCAPRAIGQQARIVVDQAESRRRRAEALEFVAHFVGDIHQPLHAGFANDLGGNSIAVTFCPNGCMGSVDNLHKVWDSGIIAMNGSQHGLTHALLQSLTETDRSAWRAAPVDVWTTDAHALANSHAYRLVTHGQPDGVLIVDLPEPVTISEGYLAVMTPVVTGQLQRAGVRLAAVLDSLAQGVVPATLTTVAPRFVESKSGSVKVRRAARSNSIVITELSPGNRAEILGIESAGKNAPKFYRIRMDDRTQGYIAKKEARVVTP